MTNTNNVINDFAETESSIKKDTLNIAKKRKDIIKNISTILQFNEEGGLEYLAGLLIQSKHKLEKEAQIFEKNGIWYFGKAKSHAYWPKIGGKSLMYFPNTKFNKEYAICDSKGMIKNIGGLQMMFQKLGLRVANHEEEEEFEIWNKMSSYIQKIPEYAELIKNSEEFFLKKLDITLTNGVWDFSMSKPYKMSALLGGKRVCFFPSSDFNKYHSIGNKLGRLTKIEDLVKVFEVLGFKTYFNKDAKNAHKNRSDEYYKEMLPQWKNDILKNRDILRRQINLIEKDGTFYFGNCKNLINLHNIKINGKGIMTFPNTEYNKRNNIGNTTGSLTSKHHLKQMLESIGFNISAGNYGEAIKSKAKDTLITPTKSNKLDGRYYKLKKVAAIETIEYAMKIAKSSVDDIISRIDASNKNYTILELKLFRLRAYRTPVNWYIDFGEGLRKISKTPTVNNLIEILEEDYKNSNLSKVSYIKVPEITGLNLFLEGIINDIHIKNAKFSEDSVKFTDIILHSELFGSKKICIVVDNTYKGSIETCDKNGKTI